MLPTMNNQAVAERSEASAAFSRQKWMDASGAERNGETGTFAGWLSNKHVATVRMMGKKRASTASQQTTTKARTMTLLFSNLCIRGFIKPSHF
jgi:hypothetical protein